MVKIIKKRLDLLKQIAIWLFLMLMIYIIFELLRKLTGGSLSFETLVIGLLIANLGYSFYIKESINKLDSKISKHIGWHIGNRNSGNH